MITKTNCSKRCHNNDASVLDSERHPGFFSVCSLSPMIEFLHISPHSSLFCISSSRCSQNPHSSSKTRAGRRIEWFPLRNAWVIRVPAAGEASLMQCTYVPPGHPRAVHRRSYSGTRLCCQRQKLVWNNGMPSGAPQGPESAIESKAINRRCFSSVLRRACSRDILRNEVAPITDRSLVPSSFRRESAQEDI